MATANNNIPPYHFIIHAHHKTIIQLLALYIKKPSVKFFT